MTLRTVLAAAAVLAFSSPVLAQEATQPTAPEAPARQPSAEELAFAQRADAFDGRMQAMVGEIQAALSEPGTDANQKMGVIDGILGTYTPEINTFADELNTFLLLAQSRSTNPEEQAAIAQALQNGPAGVRAIPTQIRASVIDAIARAQAEAAAGQQPAADGAVAGSVPVQ